MAVWAAVIGVVILARFLQCFVYVCRVLQRRGERLQSKWEQHAAAQLAATPLSSRVVPKQEYEQGLQALLKRLRPPHDPHGALGAMHLATPITHAILSENCGHLLGSGAVLMQLAHSFVASGLKHHSYAHSQTDLFKRLLRTLHHVEGIVFGTTAELESSSRHVRWLHGKVVGVVEAENMVVSHNTTAMPTTNPNNDSEPLSSASAQTTPEDYAANDLTALQWVQGTVIETGPLAYELFVKPLTNAQLEEHYQYSRQLSPVWGIDSREMPPTWDTFLDWYIGIFRSPALRVTPPAVEMFQMMLPVHWRRVHETTVLPRTLRQQFLQLSSNHDNSAPTTTTGGTSDSRAAGRDEFRWQWSRETLLTCCLYALARMIYLCLPKRFRQPPAYAHWQRRRQGNARLHWLERLGEQAWQWMLQHASTKANLTSK